MPIGENINEGACRSGEAGAGPGAIFMPGRIPGAATQACGECRVSICSKVVHSGWIFRRATITTPSQPGLDQVWRRCCGVQLRLQGFARIPAYLFEAEQKSWNCLFSLHSSVPADATGVGVYIAKIQAAILVMGDPQVGVVKGMIGFDQRNAQI